MFLEREPGQAGRADDRLAEEGVFENDYHPGNICPPCLTNCLPITKIFLHESNDLAIFFTNSGRKWSFLVNFQHSTLFQATKGGFFHVFKGG